MVHYFIVGDEMKIVTKKGKEYKINLHSFLPVIFLIGMFIAGILKEDPNIITFTYGVWTGIFFFSLKKAPIVNWPPIFEEVDEND